MAALPANLGDGGDTVELRRTTRGGRSLIYRLALIQQPERGRTGDNLGVDPPPVVELRIFHEKSRNETTDITFFYNANFFLHAALEIPEGLPQDAPCLLSGMPVSGMAYLDRPIEAGYFLFPDLRISVEGRYKFVFSLYEETKEIADRDLELSPETASRGLSGAFDYRMEIRSHSFVVFARSSVRRRAGELRPTENTVLTESTRSQGMRVVVSGQHAQAGVRTRVEGSPRRPNETVGAQYVWELGVEEDIPVSADRRYDDDIESVVSGVPSLVTGSTISSASTVAPMESIAKDIMRMFLKDRELRALFVETPYYVGIDKFRRNFRRLFRSFLSDLQREMDGNAELRLAARTLMYQSRNIVWHICNEIFRDKMASGTWSQLALQELDKEKQLHDYITG